VRHVLNLARCAVALLLVGAFLLVDGTSGEQRSADPVASPELELTADTSQFRAGNIISDDMFFNGNAMSAGEVQAFLAAKGSKCTDGAYPCLKNYRQTTWTRPADAYCGAYTGAPDETAAWIITRVGQACGISQRVLLVLLEKEQSLVTSAGTESRYKKATGYACPDTAACDTRYEGFYNQVYMAAWRFKVYAKNPGNYNYRAGRTNNILYNPNTACGSSPVFIENQATANLYIYTPYQPNAAALAAGRGTGVGTGDGCSAYGNRNFWVLFSNWFGSTQSPGGNAVVTRANAAGSALGSPVTFVSCGLKDAGCFQAFQNASFYWSPGTGAQVVKGAILQQWAALGWETGRLGYPTGEEVCGLKDSGCYQLFSNGAMYWSAASGAHVLAGEISRAWAAQKWETGPLGYPTSEEACGLRDGGCHQGFQGGSVYWLPGRGAYPVSGAFLDHWAGTRWETGALGYPTGWQTCGLRDGGCYQGFEHGAVYSSATTGVRHLVGDFLTRWGAQGHETGPLGYPTSSTICGLAAGGCYTLFQTGAIYWSPATGARIVANGAVAGRWADQQWERGPLGYPVSDTACGLRDGGCRQDFSGGTVTWTNATTRVVAGAHRDRWTALGAQGGALGWPTAEVTCAAGNESCTQRFQGGSVVTGPGGTRAVVGSVADEWQRTIGVLGVPTADEVCGLPGGGCYQLFRGGAVYRSTAGGTHAVFGAISQAWARQSWERGPLGYPTGGEVCTPAHDSCTQTFQGGTVVWSAARGAHPVIGAIVGAWTASGGTAGTVGAPHGAEICGLVRGGCYQAFDRGGIYWSPATGAHAVTGAILASWGRAGWEAGSLGYPTGDAQTAGSEVSQRFEGGTLVWNTTSGAVTRR
jgi:uncharacterized protein with LGFP repeats